MARPSNRQRREALLSLDGLRNELVQLYLASRGVDVPLEQRRAQLSMLLALIDVTKTLEGIDDDRPGDAEGTP
jgi:hypothetical protein